MAKTKEELLALNDDELAVYEADQAKEARIAKIMNNQSAVAQAKTDEETAKKNIKDGVKPEDSDVDLDDAPNKKLQEETIKLLNAKKE